MKTSLCFAFLLGLTGVASAQYALDWFTLDGGGGQSSGGAYTLAGTIGQPDAGASSGGSYTLQGGFWSAFAGGSGEACPRSASCATARTSRSRGRIHRRAFNFRNHPASPHRTGRM